MYIKSFTEDTFPEGTSVFWEDISCCIRPEMTLTLWSSYGVLKDAQRSFDDGMEDMKQKA